MSSNQKPSREHETQQKLLNLSLPSLTHRTARPLTSSSSSDSPPDPTTPHDSSQWDEFEDELDPGSWRPIFEPDSFASASTPHHPVSASEFDSLLIWWPWRSTPCKVSLVALATSIHLKKKKAQFDGVSDSSESTSILPSLVFIIIDLLFEGGICGSIGNQGLTTERERERDREI